MDKFIRVVLPCIFLLGFITGCGETTNTQSSDNKQAVDNQKMDSAGRKILTPDDYNKEQARNHGYTVIHEDTDTSADDSRCGIGGARYGSSNKKSLCDTFTQKNDWYSKNQAESRSCPAGFTRVDQAGIGREQLAGSTRQCRSTNKVTTTNQQAHFYCPHGPNLLGYRSGADATRYGVCRMKCDIDVKHLFANECGSSGQNLNTGTSNTRTTPTTKNIVTTTTTIFILPSNTTIISSVETTQPTDNARPTDDELKPVLPDLSIKSAPDNTGYHIVGIDTWFWIDRSKWIPQQKILTRNGKTYTTTATPSNLAINISGPTNYKVECGKNPGAIWGTSETDETLCSFKWKNAGTFIATALIEWSASWVCESQCGSGTLPTITSRSPEIRFDVTEIQALIQPSS